MPKAIQTTWMWHDEMTNTVMGVVVDLFRQRLQWYDEPGCACTDSDADQTISEFFEKGLPNKMNPPNDILEEIKSELTPLLASR